MRKLPDYHLHSVFSDGHGLVEGHARRAVELGLAEIGFSDHLVPASHDYVGYGLPHERLDEYVAAVRDVARRFPRLRVLLAVEVDFVPGTERETEALLERHDFDYVIGSIHFTHDAFGFDEPRNREHGSWRDPDAIFRAGYELTAQAAAWGHFDVVGHLDLAKKFGHRPHADLRDAEDAALAAIAAAGLAIELNTAGLRHAAAEIYPRASLLARARELGIAIVFGSDAHRPEDVGAGFDEALRLARAAGYDESLRLSDRKLVPLP